MRSLILPIGGAQSSCVAMLDAPVFPATDVLTVALIGVGGVIYSIGVGFHICRALPFQKATWHSFVLVAVSFYYAAILRGVVLARS